MRPADLHQSVADSLQADVMRFMAIIAFCLIAILALVRSVAPAEQRSDSAPRSEPAAPSEFAARAEPAAAAEPVHGSGRTEFGLALAERAHGRPAATGEPVAAELPTEPPSAVVESVLDEVAEPVRSPAPAPSDSIPAVAQAGHSVPDAQPDPATDAQVIRGQAADPTPPPAAAPEEEGLSLRFASEQDFLRLVNRGRIQVFAFNGDEVLTLDTGFSFRPVAAPGQVHELLPETIPELMAGALARRHGEGYRWGVAMPEAMARQIRRYVNDGATGELIIDRFGEVRHRGA